MRLNSVTYQRIMRWNSRWGVTRAIDRLRGLHSESVIQDVDIPLDRAAEFLAFLHRDDRHPADLAVPDPCPRKRRAASRCIRCDPETVYVNFGFWDVVTSREPRPRGYLNRRIERKVAELSGIKSLYSDSFYTEDEVLVGLRPRRVCRAQVPLRSRRRTARPLREVRARRRPQAAQRVDVGRRSLRTVNMRGHPSR